MAEIRLENVSKRFADGTVAVDKASFTIGTGEFFVLLGPSGCGKSTILNMIVGLETISEGLIRVKGKVVNEVDPRDRGMAMVFQSYALYPHMTVRQNMAFPLKLAKLPKQEIKQRVEEAAGILELTGLLERTPRSLSGGQRQRVAMGRAIVRNPEVFLLDEPLSNLDAKLRMQMRLEISSLQKKLGTTMVYVTHEQTEAMTMGDRLALLNNGRVQQIGTPRELYDKPRNLFTAGFIGSPAMNFVPARWKGNRLQLPMTEVPLSATLHKLMREGGEIIVGLRPEHITAVGDSDTKQPVFEVKAGLLEWLGADAYVHFEVAACRPDIPAGNFGEFARRLIGKERISMIARIDPAQRVRVGQKLRLAIDSGKIHLFDPGNGICLTAAVTP